VNKDDYKSVEHRKSDEGLLTKSAVGVCTLVCWHCDCCKPMEFQTDIRFGFTVDRTRQEGTWQSYRRAVTHAAASRLSLSLSLSLPAVARAASPRPRPRRNAFLSLPIRSAFYSLFDFAHVKCYLSLKSPCCAVAINVNSITQSQLQFSSPSSRFPFSVFSAFSISDSSLNQFRCILDTITRLMA